WTGAGDGGDQPLRAHAPDCDTAGDVEAAVRAERHVVDGSGLGDGRDHTRRVETADAVRPAPAVPDVEPAVGAGRERPGAQQPGLGGGPAGAGESFRAGAGGR